MKRGSDGSPSKVSKASVRPKKVKDWTADQDLHLRDLVCKEEISNWTIVCRRLNKQFASHRVTAKDCKARWELLNSSLSLNEELVILLTLYRGKLEVAEELLRTRVDVKDYVVQMVARTLQTAEEIKSSHPLSTLTKLQFFVCVDLAVNPQEGSGDYFEIMRSSVVDWLEVVQHLVKQKAKMSGEAFHELVQRIVLNFEDKINALLEAEIDGLKDVMHERKDNPSQANAEHGINCLHPLMGMNLFLLANYYRNHPLLN
eukprot:TRINITY_DN7787_c0_g1_i2.p1 TRINITY_DN7787_c0_g1~~TRINITY_DN7787_c0_g1_i2.p1  ORF type:complete len:258 (+),score=61.74 TRINITY_DN7787_c0_g1_i2:185-958(+)